MMLEDAAEGIDAFLQSGRRTGAADERDPSRTLKHPLAPRLPCRGASRIIRRPPGGRPGAPGPLSMSEEHILETRKLAKEFKGFVAVSDVSLQVRRGTFTRSSAERRREDDRLQPAHEVSAADGGADPFQGPGHHDGKAAQIARRGVVRSFQISATFPHLTVLENVRVALQRKLGTSFHFWKSERTLDL